MFDELGITLTPEDLTETEKQPDTERQPEAEKPEAEKPEAEKPEAEKPESEEDWTPEKLKAEADRIKSEREKFESDLRAARDTFGKARRQAAKIERERADLERAKAEIERERSEHRAAANQLLTGDARTVLATIARFTGRDPIDVYREMGEAIASDGPRVKSDSKVSELEAELKRLREAQERDAQERQRREQGQAFANAFVAGIRDAQQYPELNAYAQAVTPRKALDELMTVLNRNHQMGKPLDVDSILAQAELTLRRDQSWRAAQAAGGTETPAKPNDAPARGASVSTSQASQARSARPLSDDERENELTRLGSLAVKELLGL